MEVTLRFDFKGSARIDSRRIVLGSFDGHLIPLVGDKVVFDDGSWNVLERFFDFGENPVEITLKVERY